QAPQDLASLLPPRLERRVVEVSGRIEAGTTHGEAVERIEPAERTALRARPDERHDREPPAGRDDIGRSPQRASEVVDRSIAPGGQDGIDRLLDAAEIDGVAVHELDVAPAVACYAPLGLREHARGAVEADDASARSDGLD